MFSPTALPLAAPLTDLFQRNTAALTRFWTSSDIIAESRTALDALTRQSQASAMHLFQSPAFTELSRELFASYSKFAAAMVTTQVNGAFKAQQQGLAQTVEAVSSTLRRAA